jgi:hypothetical protein
VALEVDNLDHRSRTGWSVVVHGHAQAAAAPQHLIELWPMDQILPWAPGIGLFIQVTPAEITGQIVTRA